MTRTATILAASILLIAAPALGQQSSSSSSPLTLGEALRLARDNQPSLQQARSSRLAAQAQVEVARAPLLPQITGTGAYSRATANYVAPAGSLPSSVGSGSVRSNSFETFPYWRFGVNATQTLWDFGQTLAQWRVARAQSEAEGANLRATEAAIAYGVRVAFFTARAAKDMVRVARETLENQEKHLKQIQGFVELGSRPEIDLSQARADRANARVALINGENAYDVARAQLNLAIGVERSVDYELSDDGLTGVGGEESAVDGLVDEAVGARPEVARLQLLTLGQELSLKATRAGYWPTLNLNLGLTDNGRELDGLTWNLSGALTLSVPIFTGLATTGQIHVGEAQVAQSHAQLNLERQQIRLEVEQARLGVRAAKAAILAADDALTNTRDRLRLAEGRYQTGVGNVIELGDAQVALTAAGAQKVQAEYQLFTARAQLLKALGRS